ncbi:MAG TPA: DUF2157 domain-containing protein [Terriglobales bacterium]|jgi:uncharacterized membrane protein|nr:DUF2157 domain-containing protein [Terriglobales bacterium]
MPTIDDELERWVGAGVIDAPTADRIRVFEKSREQPSGLRWQVLLALIFGALLLAAGVSLFVAAHWDELSPAARFSLVMATLIVLHGAGLWVRPKFERLAIVQHGVGTVAAGGAVALVGQIFNIQEHWPAGILLWALCALAGWALLRDQVQQTISLLLIPAWIICEWSLRTDGYRGGQLLITRMVTVFAAAYLTAFLNERKKLVFGLLFSAGAIGLIVATAMLCEDEVLWYEWSKDPIMPALSMIFVWFCIVALPLLFAWRMNRPAVLPVAVIAAMAAVLPHLYRHGHDRYTTWTYNEPSWVSYAVVAGVAAFLAWWGVQQRSRAVINYGIVCFALTILWFYFSSVMGKLERSFSLIVLGVLFLGGGWVLEKTRRKLVRQIGVAA